MKNICKAPFTGFVIGPRGEINFCCMGVDKDYVLSENLNEIDDLQDFFIKSKDLNRVRNQFLNGEYSTIKPCSDCYKLEKTNRITFKKSIGERFPSDLEPTHIRNLEFTASNLCNATCATCSSIYSSSWIKHEKQMGKKYHDTTKLSKHSIEKIIKILPTLEWFHIKGGEPFVDKNNFIILNKHFDVNDKCNVTIHTNMSILTDYHIKTLKKIGNKISLYASVDGIGSVYNWIRSTDFKSVIHNMEKLFYETGIQLKITTTLSIYNYFQLPEIIDYFLDKPYVRFISYKNILRYPEASSITSLPEELFYEQKNKIIKHNEKIKFSFNYEEKFYQDAFGQFKSVTPSKENKKIVFDHIDIINKMRQFDICDHVSELKRWRDNANYKKLN
jgi:MoaA/NifB/PqqE/SkfB family radical SAM enzyme